MTSRTTALLSFALLLAPLDAFAATYRNRVAQVPSAPDSTQSVRVWMDSDTAFGETAGIEVQIGGTYTRYYGTFDAVTYPGANWYADIPAQPAGTLVQYQLFTRNESSTDYGYTGFNWSYTVQDVDAGSTVDAGGAADVPGVDASDASDTDSGTAVDAGTADSGPVDVGEPADAGTTDSGPIDAGEPAEAGAPDVPIADASVDVAMDSSAVDAGTDSGTPDAGPIDVPIIDGDVEAGFNDVVPTDARPDASDGGPRDASSDAARADVAPDAPGTMNNSGCNCRTTGSSSRTGLTPLIALAAIAIGSRRRRSTKRPHSAP